jgi:translation initiation factor IF-2
MLNQLKTSFPVFCTKLSTHSNPISKMLRPPIVTIMGHVDHGKTTMLDFLRKTNVASGEAGGITQHIGAFQVSLMSQSTSIANTRLITFIDTPGHASFSKIRQRGAKVTDLIVLVVAVEDGVMPQTDEVIALSKTSQTPLIVAINKWDKLVGMGGAESSLVRKLKEGLARRGLELEEFGGSVQCIPVSAITGYNMESLKEAIIAEAEMMELTADPEGALHATVIESKTAHGLGPVATVVVQEGTLKPGMFVSSENTYCRIRGLRDFAGKSIKEATPSMPVEIIGWKNSIHPMIGSKLISFANESECKAYVSDIARLEQTHSAKVALQDVRKRENLDRQLLKLRRERSKDLSSKPIHILSYEDVTKTYTKPCLEIVLHADVVGSQEALIEVVNSLPHTKVDVSIIEANLGSPSESTIDMLETCTRPALVLFNCSLPKSIEKLCKDRNIPIISNNIIYHLIDDLESAMANLLPSIKKETVLGAAKVLQLFPLGKDAVLGCRVDDGIITRQLPPNSASNTDSQAPQIIFALFRSGEEIWRGPIKSLRHLKKDISQAQKGLECGIVLEDMDKSLIEVDDTVRCIKLSFTRPSIK